MTRYFDVANKSRMGFWCVAEDEEDAAKLAEEFGHVKKASNATVTEYDPPDGVKYFVENGMRGRLIQEITVKPFKKVLEDMTHGTHTPAPNRWILMEGKQGPFHDVLGNSGENRTQLPPMEA